MSKVVVRTQYFASGKSVGEKFTNYIAKREGVDKTINTKRSEVFVQYAAERSGVVKLGEHGLFGREEIDEIIPAIEAAKAEGINADGPVPPDTVFSKARGGWYDIVVAMYHDQGHIPLKVVGFVYNHEKKAWDAVAGVNITLGLPIIRVSVDHGTAFDQAGTGTASELSLRNSIEYAVMFANNKN